MYVVKNIQKVVFRANFSIQKVVLNIQKVVFRFLKTFVIYCVSKSLKRFFEI